MQEDVGRSQVWTIFFESENGVDLRSAWRWGVHGFFSIGLHELRASLFRLRMSPSVVSGSETKVHAVGVARLASFGTRKERIRPAACEVTIIWSLAMFKRKAVLSEVRNHHVPSIRSISDLVPMITKYLDLPTIDAKFVKCLPFGWLHR